jgi:multisubunit Na+/H+ antiporter MnhC subunit
LFLLVFLFSYLFSFFILGIYIILQRALLRIVLGC